MRGFRDRVIKIVANIPKGKTLSYKEVAQKAGNEKAARAVGRIMNTHSIKNLPCHRVIRSDGTIGGYLWGVKKKREILRKEGVEILRN